jgi:hypothetical protein
MMRHAASLRALLLHTLLLAAAQACTVLVFTEHAFSANTGRLLRALPLFEGTNGTLFLDTSLSTHKCHPEVSCMDFTPAGMCTHQHPALRV